MFATQNQSYNLSKYLIILIASSPFTQLYAAPAGKPAILVPSNGRTVQFNNRFSDNICFYPSESKGTIYPALDYDSEVVCDTQGPVIYFNIYNQLATKYKNAWYCLTAVSQADLNKYTYQYVTFTPCVMTELRQRWRYDKSLDNFVSIANQRPLGEVSWTLAQAKTDSGVYPLRNTSKLTYNFQDWMNKPTAPANASYYVRFAWSQKERPDITHELTPQQGYYNPLNKQLYVFVSNTSKCMTSLRVKTGASDGVSWESCDLTVGTAKTEHQWNVSMPDNLRSSVSISDGKGNPLLVFNSVYSGALYGKLITVSASQPSSLVAPATGKYEVGSDYYNFAIASAKNLMGMVESGFCPAPGIKAQSTSGGIIVQPRMVPRQVNWQDWLSRMYEIARNDDNRTRLGSLLGSDLQAMEIITEATLEGQNSVEFLRNPFGIMYNTDTPPGTTYNSVQRFSDQRHVVSTQIEQQFQATSAALNALQQAGTLNIDQAAIFYRTFLNNAYNLISPQLTTSLYASETRGGGGLAPAHFQNLYQRLNQLPLGSTFIFRATSFPDPNNLLVRQVLPALGIVGYDGNIRILPASTMGRPSQFTEQWYRQFYNGARITSGTAIMNFLGHFFPQTQLFHMADIYLVDRRGPPPAPITTSIGTQTELSAGNCTASTQTDMSGDGGGMAQYRINFCDTSSGRCMDR